MQLLFCSTYAFETPGATGNWAVAKFPCMIAVDEIRIIPLGTKVHSQLHDDQFMGQTAPSKFRVEFFSDDRSASMTTYEHVGSMEYAEGSPNRFHPPSALYSEKLLLNGWFTHITFAVYGGILSEVGVGAPTLDLNLKTPSLIIHGNQDGRSVYIRGMPDVPQLTKEIDKPASLLDPLPGVTDEDFLLGRGAKSYLGLEESINRRQLEDIRMQNVDDQTLGGEMGGSYYDRRQQRDRFGSDVGRFQRKPYGNDNNDYQGHPRNVSGRKTMLPDNQDNYRSDFNEPRYRDKPRFGHHARHETVDNSDLTKREHRERGPRASQDDSGDRKENSSNSEERRKVQDLRENLRRGHRNAADKDGQQEWMDGEYEEISDEEIEEERVAALQDMEDIVSAEMLSQTSMMCFNPFLMEPLQLIHFNHPEMTDFEISYHNLLVQQHGETHGQPATADDTTSAELQKLVEKCKNIIPKNMLEKVDSFLDVEQGKTVVEALEEISTILLKALPTLAVHQRKAYDEYAPLLVSWTLAALDNKLLSSQAIGTNLRMLKAGISLAHKLCLTTQEIVVCLSDAKLDERLISLLSMKNMASSVKISIIHTLDAYLSWPSAISGYFGEDEINPSESYGKLVELLLTPQTARVVTALSRLMNKVKLAHSMFKLRMAVEALVVHKIPNAEDDYDFDDDYATDENDSDVVEEEIVLEEEEMMVMSSTSNDEDEELPANEDVHHFREPVTYARKGAKISEDSTGRQQLQEKLSSESEPVVTMLPVEDTTVPLEAAICLGDVALTQSDIDDIAEYISLLTIAVEDVKGTIMQLPKRSFPTAPNASELSDKDARASFFRMMEFYNVLPAIHALLALPVVSAIPEVYEAAYTFLDVLMSRQDSLAYLASNAKTVILLSKHLLSSSAALSVTEAETPGTGVHLGAKLAFHVQAVICLDQLHSLPASEEIEQEHADDSVEILKVLYSLAYPTFGKHWLAQILSLEDNILALLKRIQLPKEEEKKEEQPDAEEKKESESKDEQTAEEEASRETKKRATRKSAATGFSINIILGMLKLSPNTSYLLPNADKVSDIMKKVASSRAVEETAEWLRPLDALTNEKGNIVSLMEFVKNTSDKLEWNTLLTSGPGLCTALRLLCHLVHAENPYCDSRAKNRGKTDPESYLSALQIFSAGGLSVLVSAVTQLNKCFAYPCFSQHSLTTIFSYNFQNVVGAISESLLVLVNHLLKLLLGTADGKFQADQVGKPLTELFCGLYVALRETNMPRLDVMLELIVSIFSTLIEKCEANKEENVEADAGSVILRDVLTSIQERCQCIVPGTVLLSHMLPLPLPLIAEDEYLSEKSLKEIVALRDSWESRLTNFVEPLSMLVSTLSHSTCIPLLNGLVPLIQQVVDLSPSLSSTMLSAATSACMTVEKAKEPEVADGKAEQEESKSPQKVTWHVQPLRVLSEIITQPSAKATLLSQLHADEKHVLRRLWEELRDGGKSPRLLTEAAGIANCLLDPQLRLLPEGETGLPDPCLADCVLMAASGLTSPSMTATLSCLTCLTLASTTEFGFAQTRSVLVKHPSALNALLDRVLGLFSKDADFASDVVCQFCRFIKELAWPNERRSSFLSKAEIKSVLKWNKEFTTHPLLSLKAKLEKSDYDDERSSRALDEITTLCQTLKTSQKSTRPAEKSGKKSAKDKENQKAISLEEQYKLRDLWVYGCEEEAFFTRLCILTGSGTNRSRSTKDSVKVDLVDMAEKFCSGFNLENSLKELTESAKTVDIDKIRMEAKAKRLKKLETFSTRHGKTLTYIKRSHGLLGAAPRGRGRGRGGVSQGRHYDLFRQRKQNTSRPPSMHVDDFIAADEEDKDFPAPAAPPAASQFVPSRRTSRPFKRDFTPRGRGARGMSRTIGLGRGSFASFGAGEGGTGNPTVSEKFRNKPVGGRFQDRFPRGRGRARDPNRTPFSPREGFKSKPPSWSVSPRNFGGFGSNGGFRGGRGNKLMGMGRPLLPPPPPIPLRKWGGMPPPRRGRGYGKPRGKHIRSFTR